MTHPVLTPLQLELNSLQPGEVREHAAIVNGVPDRSSFYRVSTRGEALVALYPLWTNAPKPELIPRKTPRPRLPHIPELQPVPLSVPEPPVIVFDGQVSEFGHLYSYAWVALMAEPLLSCILELDGEAIEYVPAKVVDHTGKVRADLPKCFFVLPRRAIDCIDAERTTVRLSFLEPLLGITNPMRMCEFDGYAVRRNIPEDVHIFSNVFNGDLMFSVELIERAKQRGVWGISARRTEKGMAEHGINF